MPDSAVVRKIDVSVEVDIWDRISNTKIETINLTRRELFSYTFQKTIKNPNSSGSITLSPQYSVTNRHFFNKIKPFDIAKIYEFGQLKFIGIIRKINGDGAIGEDGNPNRSVVLELSGMGGYLSEAKIGISAIIFNESSIDPLITFQNIQENFKETIAGGIALDRSLTYRELVNFALDTWFTLLNSIGGSRRFDNIINEYFNFTSGVGDFPRPLWPKEWDLYQGNYDDITLWSLLDNLLDIPFNELFFDEGPRKVVLNGSVANLDESKVHLILRNTPFNGSVPDGGSGIENRFDVLPEKIVENIVQYKLNRSMEEVYTLYITSAPIWNLSQFELIAHGFSVPDREKFAKYLYLPLSVKLNNIRIPDIEETKLADMPRVDQRIQNAAETLKRWFENNDVFYNGVITTHVPQEGDDDVRIGEKIALIGEEGHFYCESITHVWTYGGSLLTHLGVTRGFDYARNRPIEFQGPMFERQGIFK